jgi:hypothetical protein
MSSLDMKGPYKLIYKAIEQVVEDGRKGNYSLGELDDEGKFVPHYVGRSDTDVKDRLLYWVEHNNRPYFKFSYAETVRAAFEKECQNYHDFSPKDNDIHPARPKGENYPCPYCDK